MRFRAFAFFLGRLTSVGKCATESTSFYTLTTSKQSKDTQQDTYDSVWSACKVSGSTDPQLRIAVWVAHVDHRRPIDSITPAALRHRRRVQAVDPSWLANCRPYVSGAGVPLPRLPLVDLGKSVLVDVGENGCGCALSFRLARH